MEEEKQTLNEDTESSSVLEDAIEDSSTSQQQTQETETATPEQAETQEQETQEEEKPFHEHPRFKELVEEKNWYRNQFEQLMNQRQQQLSSPSTPQTPQDPYANMTPEEEKFWRMVDKRAEQIADQKLQRISPVIDAGRNEIAAMRVKAFRDAHPDIKPNSPEEVEIGERIRAGYVEEDAYWAVMGPRGKQFAENQAVKKVKQNIQQKKQANVNASPGVSQSTKPPDKISLKDDFERNWNLMEQGKL